jgi:hypothetical protein
MMVIRWQASRHRLSFEGIGLRGYAPVAGNDVHWAAYHDPRNCTATRPADENDAPSPLGLKWSWARVAVLQKTNYPGGGGQVRCSSRSVL